MFDAAGMAASRAPSCAPRPRLCRVQDDTGRFVARRAVREVARQFGFSTRACEELAIVVSELASNILKYGVKGSIEIGPVEDLLRGVGILIVAQDETPAFDLAMATNDGHDAKGKLDPMKMFRRGGIGAGIGAIARFSDELQIAPCPGGKRIRVVRFVKRPRSA